MRRVRISRAERNAMIKRAVPQAVGAPLTRAERSRGLFRTNSPHEPVLFPLTFPSWETHIARARKQEMAEV